MAEKKKKLATVNIKGKEYVTVAERVRHFNEEYPQGSIQTNLLSDISSEQIVMRAVVTPDVDKPERKFTGYSQEKVGEGMVNKTSALENAETSAVGRALGLMGIGILEGIASVDEINKAENRKTYTLDPNKTYKASQKQLEFLKTLLAKHGITEQKYCEEYGLKDIQLADGPTVSQSIEKLKNKPVEPVPVEEEISMDDIPL